MDFGFGPDGDALREELRSFLAEAMTPELEEKLYRSGVAHDETFTAALRERGWLAPSWPPDQGGHGLDPLAALVVHEEMQRADAPVYGAATNNMVCHTLVRMGSEELVREVVPAALRGGRLPEVRILISSYQRARSRKALTAAWWSGDR